MAINVIPKRRGRDPQGAGYFGASRGGRRHLGVDFVESFGENGELEPGDVVRSMNAGTVTKIGWPYSFDKIEELRSKYGDDVPAFRYVQVSDGKGFDCRYFYIDPLVEEGDAVEIGDELGELQWLPYPDIEQHYHFEVLREHNGKPVDPDRYLSGDMT